MTLLDQTQDFNPLTWDVQLNPAAWWLSMKDINSAASIELKSSLYSGNVNLTADQYREVQELVNNKYSWVDYTGMIKGSWMLSDVNMLGRDPGLYMNQERFWYWKNDTDQWQAYIANNGNFAFQWDANNYISWNWAELTIRGTILLEDWSPAWEWLVTFSQSTIPTALNVWDIWYNTTTTITTRWDGAAWVSMRDIWASKADTALDSNARYQKWLDTNLIPEVKSKTWYTWVVLDNDWIGWYTAWVPTFQIDRITWSAYFKWNISWSTIEWSNLIWWSIKTALSWNRVELVWSTLYSIASNWSFIWFDSTLNKIQFSKNTWQSSSLYFDIFNSIPYIRTEWNMYAYDLYAENNIFTDQSLYVTWNTSLVWWLYAQSLIDVDWIIYANWWIESYTKLIIPVWNNLF